MRLALLERTMRRVDTPRTHYARSDDGTSLAYQVFGEGDIDLLYIPGFISHVEVGWELPAHAQFLRQLGSHARVIWFDKRGVGLSDRSSLTTDLDTWLADARAVLEAAGSEQTVLWGDGPDGGGACAVFAASHPERTLGFIWWGGASRTSYAPDYPWGLSADQIAADNEDMLALWSDDLDGPARAMRAMAGEGPLRSDPAFMEWGSKLTRYAASPSSALALNEVWVATDVRGVLSSIRVPTLVMFWGEDPEAAYTAERIPGARLANLPPSSMFPAFLGDTQAVMAAFESFLRIVRAERAELDRVLATVLFTDIVASTERAASIGDRAWRDLIERHHAIVRSMLARYRGTEIDTAGDGFFATFDGPARAVHCATALIDAVGSIDLEIRAGVHTGEVQTIDGKVGGIAVVIGARVGASAGASEVLVSQTVKDLVAGSGLTFEDAGEHELKGIPDRWHLYRVVR